MSSIQHRCKPILLLREIQVTFPWAATENERKIRALPEQIGSVWELPFSTCAEQLLETQL